MLLRNYRLGKRKMRNVFKKLSKLRRKKRVVLVSIVALLLLYLWLKDFPASQRTEDYNCMQIDVVYTWVNGSDPLFIELAQKYEPSYDPARFDDKNELRYSLRSLELYAPWIRHVYIVTNGQIPHWLDLSYERVTIVPHEVLAPNLKQLPTFSSSAIETFIHRIPNLSQRFLYLNDDIFLNAPLYPEDLYSEGEGVRVYQAWMVPDCAEDCPWTYIGDGACDRHCNIAQCQYDGGDCAVMPADSNSNELLRRDIGANEQLDIKPALVKQFPKRRKQRIKHSTRNSTNFKELMKGKNLTEPQQLRQVVAKFNKIQQIKPSGAVEDATEASQITSARETESAYKSTKDIYSHSLIYTNMLLNRYYGFKPRNVLAHVGFLLDRQIIEEMQLKFAEEFNITSSHRFRAANDVQYAFAYYSYVMSEQRVASVEEIFDDFDTDHSQTWSDREIRTFLARMYPLPLDWSAVKFFEEVVTNCSRNLVATGERLTEEIVYTTLVYERYEDSTLPTVTRGLVSKCPLLADALVGNFGTRQKYKHNINPKRIMHSNFMMLTSNVTEVVDALDKMRKNPRKFNCINDNLEPQNTEDNHLIRHLLEDFYLSFFPARSKFELDPQYRNRYENWQDYQRWRRRKRAVLGIGYCATLCLVLFITKFLCVHKAKFARRYVQKI